MYEKIKSGMYCLCEKWDVELWIFFSQNLRNFVKPNVSAGLGGASSNSSMKFFKIFYKIDTLSTFKKKNLKGIFPWVIYKTKGNMPIMCQCCTGLWSFSYTSLCLRYLNSFAMVNTSFDDAKNWNLLTKERFHVIIILMLEAIVFVRAMWIVTL